MIGLVDGLLVALALAFLLALVRVVVGPSLPDRVVAADVCFLTVVGFLALVSVRRDVVEFIDVVLVATLLGFVATISLAWLVQTRSR